MAVFENPERPPLTPESANAITPAHLAAALEHASEAILLTDTGGRIIYVNRAFEKATGYGRDEVIGRNPRFLKSEEHDASFYGEMWTTLQRNEVWSGTIVNRAKNGRLLHESMTISPVRDPGGELIGYVSVKRLLESRAPADSSA